METRNDTGPRCASYLPAVMQESVLTSPLNPVRSYLETFEEEFLRTERIAHDSGLLFDPDNFASVLDFPGAQAEIPPNSKGQPTGSMRARWEAGFSAWLASCVSMQDWIGCADESSRPSIGGVPSGPASRCLIKDAARLYRSRGTPYGLVAAVQAICNLDIEVVERSCPRGMTIGTSSNIGVSSWLTDEPDLARQFTIVIRPTERNEAQLKATPFGTRPAVTRTVSRLHSAARSEMWIWGPWHTADSSLFTSTSFTDAAGLIRRLVNQSDPVSSHLWRKLSGTRQQVLRDPTADITLKVSSLVEGLNDILRGPSIYDSRHFPAEKLSTRTFALISKTLTPEEMLRLNRLLLEDAYPEEISRLGEPDETGTPGNHGALDTNLTERSERVSRRLHNLIDREKPAHTSFYLAMAAPAPQIVAAGDPWLRIGLREATFPSQFSAEDVRDPVGLTRKFVRRSDLVSQFLWNALGGSVQRALASPDTPLPEAHSLLLGELNRIIQGPSIYQPGRFAQVTLSKEAATIFSQQPEGQELARLNRLFLEDAYPQEIVKALRSPCSSIGRFCIK